jgi:hypothetical protein
LGRLGRYSVSRRFCRVSTQDPPRVEAERNACISADLARNASEEVKFAATDNENEIFVTTDTIDTSATNRTIVACRHSICHRKAVPPDNWAMDRPETKKVKKLSFLPCFRR